MRYGRHLFVKFNDGMKARAWLRSMFKRVNARSKEHGKCFTVNIGFTYEGLKALGLSQRSLDSFPEAFQGRHAWTWERGGRSSGRTRQSIGKAGLGGPDIHAMGLIRTDSDQGPRDGRSQIIRAEIEATGGVEIQLRSGLHGARA